MLMKTLQFLFKEIFYLQSFLLFDIKKTNARYKTSGKNFHTRLFHYYAIAFHSRNSLKLKWKNIYFKMAFSHFITRFLINNIYSKDYSKAKLIFFKNISMYIEKYVLLFTFFFIQQHLVNNQSFKFITEIKTINE